MVESGLVNRIVKFAFTKQKCQDYISGYTKTEDYSEVSLIVIPHYFGCINLDSEFICILVFWYYFGKNLIILP